MVRFVPAAPIRFVPFFFHWKRNSDCRCGQLLVDVYCDRVKNSDSRLLRDSNYNTSASAKVTLKVQP